MVNICFLLICKLGSERLTTVQSGHGERICPQLHSLRHCPKMCGNEGMNREGMNMNAEEKEEEGKRRTSISLGMLSMCSFITGRRKLHENSCWIVHVRRPVAKLTPCMVSGLRKRGMAKRATVES